MEQAAETALGLLPGNAGGPRPVIDGTGVPLHTYLGRAPLSAAARQAVAEAAGPTDVEPDLATGVRARRGRSALVALRAGGPAARAAQSSTTAPPRSCRPPPPSRPARRPSSAAARWWRSATVSACPTCSSRPGPGSATSGGLLVAGEVPGAPVVGELVPQGSRSVVLR